jgi:arylsulfatase A-like enzyme
MKTVVICIIILLVVSIGCREKSSEDRINVLLILLDTVRADHLHCYGYPRETTPTIDSLAGMGTRWIQVQAQSSWTLPAMTSIFTGTTERTHRAGLRNGKAFGLSEYLETMPVLLKDAGYTTGAFFNVPVMAPSYGFTRGFDYFDCRGCSIETTKAEEVVDSFINWMDNRNRSNASPFFVALHLFDPHSPYDPPDPFRTMWTDPDYSGPDWPRSTAAELITGYNSGEIDSTALTHMINSYDGEIAYTDSQLRRVFNYLHEKGHADNTLIILVADHGEEFGEHGGVLHGFQLYQETTRVPLIITGPGISIGYIDHNVVGQIDILPSLLEYLKIPVPEQVEGRNIIGLNENAEPVMLPASGFITTRDIIVTRLGSRKVFWNSSDDTSVMYDLTADREENNPLQADSELVEGARYYWTTPAMFDPLPVPGQEMFSEKLKDLGYL